MISLNTPFIQFTPMPCKYIYKVHLRGHLSYLRFSIGTPIIIIIGTIQRNLLYGNSIKVDD